MWWVYAELCTQNCFNFKIQNWSGKTIELVCWNQFSLFWKFKIVSHLHFFIFPLPLLSSVLFLLTFPPWCLQTPWSLWPKWRGSSSGNWKNGVAEKWNSDVLDIISNLCNSAYVDSAVKGIKEYHHFLWIVSRNELVLTGHHRNNRSCLKFHLLDSPSELPKSSIGISKATWKWRSHWWIHHGAAEQVRHKLSIYSFIQ